MQKIISYINIIKVLINQGDNPTEIFLNLKKLVKEGYILVRQDRGVILELCSIYDEFIKYSFSLPDELIPVPWLFWTRINSLINFKNNVLLQYDLTKEQLDIYLQETRMIMDKNVYDFDGSSIFKVQESIAKIQHGYNVLKIDISLEKEYKDLMDVGIIFLSNIINNNTEDKVLDTFNTFLYADNSANSNFLAALMFNSLFTDELKKGLEHIEDLKNVMFYWKMYRYEYYGYTQEQIDADKRLLDFKFVYDE